MRRPTKCPICGSKITKVTNAVTKNSYFKCSNEECQFVLGSDYTDAEFYLQGQVLKTTCLKCNSPLVVVNGPHGLYPRCTHCTCDFEPTFYNGKMYSRWVNARRSSAREEIENLINSFNTEKTTDDELYDFNAFIASTSVKETSKVKEGATNTEKILSVLLADINTPMGATEINARTEINIASIRTGLLSLRSLGLVKIVGYKANVSGNHSILYQSTESPLPEIQTYKKEDGYNTVISFLRDNADKYGSVIRAKEVLTKGLRDAKQEPILFHSSRGICSGYPISVMEKIMNNQCIQTKLPLEVESAAITGSRREGANKILNVFRENIKTPYTMSQIAEKINASRCYTKSIIRDLRKAKKLKVVGWEVIENQRGATALQYQLTESPLPKFKTTVDNNLYATFKQFYRKKLKGKRITSMAKAEKEIKNLPVIPLIINQRAYVGYSVADLKETFKKYIENPTPVKRTCRPKKEVTPVDVETVLMLSQEETSKAVSNPIKKKSIFSSFVSLFQKKEKVHS